MRRTRSTPDGLRQRAREVVGGAIVGQVILAASAPLLAILVTPGVFGTYSAASALGIVIAFIGTLSYESALPTSSTTAQASNSYWAGICQIVVLAVLCIAISLALQLRGVRGALGFGTAVAVVVVGASVGELTTGWMVYKGANHKLALSRASSPIVQAIAQCVLGATLASPLALALGFATGRISILVVAGGRIRPTLTRPSLAIAYRANRRFAHYSMPSQLLTSLSNSGVMIALPLLYGADVAGVVGLSRRVIAAPVNVVARALSLSYLAETAANVSDHNTAIAIFRRYVGISIRYLVPCVALVCLLSIVLLERLLGEDWESVGVIVLALSPMYVGQSISVPVSKTFQVLDGQGTLLAWSCWRLAAIGLWVLTSAILIDDYLRSMLLFAVLVGVYGLIQTHLAYRLVTDRYVLDHNWRGTAPRYRRWDTT